MKRMLNRALSGAFEAWQSNAADSKRDGAALAKGLMRLINGMLGAAFEIELVKLSQRVFSFVCSSLQRVMIQLNLSTSS